MEALGPDDFFDGWQPPQVLWVFCERRVIGG
jgi:hypothetical protein